MTISHHELAGLTSNEAKARLAHYGYNEVSEAKPHALLTLLRKFWAPVPWMLEATIALTLLTARYLDAAIIGCLLVFNIIISFLQEGRAEQTLALLRERLATSARVLRDGQWQQVAARELVPDDVIHVRMGDIIPADITIHEGALIVDQSALTGESVPVEKAGVRPCTPARLPGRARRPAPSSPPAQRPPLARPPNWSKRRAPSRTWKPSS